MPALEPGEDPSVPSRTRTVAFLRVLLTLGTLFAIAIAESAGRRWPAP